MNKTQLKRNSTPLRVQRHRMDTLKWDGYFFIHFVKRHFVLAFVGEVRGQAREFERLRYSWLERLAGF